MKTMQTAGRGTVADMKRHGDVYVARHAMRQEYEEARFETQSLRTMKPYMTNEGNEWRYTEYAARLKVQHDIARAALRNLNAMKAPKSACTVCCECEPIAAYGGWCCVKALKAEVTP